jgi:hypothetical protein
MQKRIFPHKLRKQAAFLEKSRFFWQFLAIFSNVVPVRLARFDAESIADKAA